jgi:DNA (cytosine-5)-methyltransferase 1
MRTMHLFAGAGGGLLADRILGHTPVVAVEWEPYPCQVLRERAAEGWFPGLVVWEGDVRNFDPSEYTRQVDCIHAGFPCQDISVAGKQAGVGEETRSGLYREVLRIAGTVRPRLIFLENVAAIKSNGLEQVIKDLAVMGYDTRWMCIRASDVGAPHHRDRWFALAYPNSARCEGLWDSSERGAAQNSEFSMASEELADSQNKKNVRGQWGMGTFEEEHHNRGSQTDGSREWWEVEPNLGRVADGVAHRIHRLKALGNGQVPLQVAVAFRILSEGLTC